MLHHSVYSTQYIGTSYLRINEKPFLYRRYNYYHIVASVPCCTSYRTYDFHTIIQATGISSCYDGGTSLGVLGSSTVHSDTANSHGVNVSHVAVRCAIVELHTTIARREYIY